MAESAGGYSVNKSNAIRSQLHTPTEMSQEDDRRLKLLKSKIGEFADFPKAGINFK